MDTLRRHYCLIQFSLLLEWQALELPGMQSVLINSSKIVARGLGSKKRETDAVPPRQRSLRIQV
jgi:hypothetical protein